jgi:hypothetical protein
VVLARHTQSKLIQPNIALVRFGIVALHAIGLQESGSEFLLHGGRFLRFSRSVQAEQSGNQAKGKRDSYFHMLVLLVIFIA